MDKIQRTAVFPPEIAPKLQTYDGDMGNWERYSLRKLYVTGGGGGGGGYKSLTAK